MKLHSHVHPTNPPPPLKTKQQNSRGELVFPLVDSYGPNNPPLPPDPTSRVGQRGPRRRRLELHVPVPGVRAAGLASRRASDRRPRRETKDAAQGSEIHLGASKNVSKNGGAGEEGDIFGGGGSLKLGVGGAVLDGVKRNQKESGGVSDSFGMASKGNQKETRGVPFLNYVHIRKTLGSPFTVLLKGN